MRVWIAFALLACGRSERVPDAGPQTLRELVPPGRVDAHDWRLDAEPPRDVVLPDRIDARDRDPGASTAVAATTGIEGRVLLAGKPLANVIVSVKHVYGFDIYEVKKVSSDADGHYKLDVRPDPDLQINAFTENASEPKSSRSHVTVVDGAYTHLDITLGLAASIEGRVVDRKGAGVAQLDVQLICSSRDGGCSMDGRNYFKTATDGTFHCGGIDHGDYWVVVRKPGERDVTITIKPLAKTFPTIHLAKDNSVVRGVRIAIDPNATAPL